MTDVCQEAGVSRGTLYRYFPTRDQLLAAAADHVQRRFEQAVSAAVAADPDRSDRVAVVVGAVVTFGNGERYRRLLDNEPGLVRDYFAKRLEKFVEPVAVALAPATGGDDSVSPRLDPWTVADILVRLALSYAQASPTGALTSAKDLDVVVDRLLGRSEPVSGYRPGSAAADEAETGAVTFSSRWTATDC